MLKDTTRFDTSRGGPGGGRGEGWGSQDGCERRIEVFVKIQKKNGGGGGQELSGWGGGGVRVDVMEELKFWGKFTKKFQGGVGSKGVRWEGVGLVGGGQCWG